MDIRQKIVGARNFNLVKVSSACRAILLVFLLAAFQCAFAQVQPPESDINPVNFDHIKTGFNLTGAHASARCSYCHIQGVYRGTPRECAGCHMEGNRMGAVTKPNRHIFTIARCDSCHNASVWIPATFSHVGLALGSCQTCHNGFTATGKSSGHLPVTTSCDNCHRTTDWLQQVVFSHQGIVSGCSNCHSGQAFLGVKPLSKPSNHVDTQNQDCASCHPSTTSFQVATAASMPAGHVPTQMACQTCHSSFGPNSGVMNHAGIVNGCAQCHNGQRFAGVTPMSKAAFSAHPPTAADCSSCHSSTVSFATNVSMSTLPTNHFPTSLACSVCHNSAAFIPGVMSHTGIVNNCTSCHSGQRFTGVTPVAKPTNHLPTSTGCETCHSTSNFTAFSNATMSHVGIVNNCTNCHNGQTFAGVTPMSKAAFPSHPPTAADCSTCHSSTVSFATNVSMTTLPANHLPTSSACSTCHNPAAFIPGVMSHTGIVNNCTSCHNGQRFVGVTPAAKPTNHLPTSGVCEACHSSSNFVAFSGAAMSHAGIVNNCTNCHNGQRFVGVTPMAKPTNHLPTNSGCETCHSSSIAFSGARMTHSGIVNGCAQCHNGQVFAGVTPLSKAAFPAHQVTSDDCSVCHSSTSSFASGVSTSTKPADHLPTSAACSTCHNAAAFVPGVMNHAGITNGCATCHNGQRFAGVTPISKPSNHIPYAANLTGGASMGCEFCHSPSVFTRFTALTSSTTMHNNTQGNGSGSCKACHLSGTNYLGGMRRNSLNHEGSGNDCSQSGCHKPLGRKGTAYINWD